MDSRKRLNAEMQRRRAGRFRLKIDLKGCPFVDTVGHHMKRPGDAHAAYRKFVQQNGGACADRDLLREKLDREAP